MQTVKNILLIIFGFITLLFIIDRCSGPVENIQGPATSEFKEQKAAIDTPYKKMFDSSQRLLSRSRDSVKIFKVKLAGSQTEVRAQLPVDKKSADSTDLSNIRSAVHKSIDDCNETINELENQGIIKDNLIAACDSSYNALSKSYDSAIVGLQVRDAAIDKLARKVKRKSKFSKIVLAIAAIVGGIILIK